MRTHYRARGYTLRLRDAKYFVRECGYHYSPAASLVPALLEEVERVMAMPSQGFVQWAIPWAYVRALPSAFVPVVAVELAKISKELPDEILIARARGHEKPTDARSQAMLCKACLDLVAFDFQERHPGSRDVSRRLWIDAQLVMNAEDWILFWALVTYLPWGVGKHLRPRRGQPESGYDPVSLLERRCPEVFQQLMALCEPEEGAKKKARHP